MEKTGHPREFNDLLMFLCKKHHIDSNRVFVEYSSRPPPQLKGGIAGFYEGLLSYRKKDGQNEFLITVFKVSREPLLTLAHEFAHLVRNLDAGNFDKELEPPDEEAEKMLDEQALKDLSEFQGKQRSSREKNG
jgi:hypothetical protein